MAARKGGKKKGGGKGEFFRAFLLLGLLAATLVAAFVLLILRPYENQHRAPVKIGRDKPPVIHHEEGGAKSNLSVPEANNGGKDGKSPAPLPESRQAKPAGELPQVAIVIDDMGYQAKLDEDLLRLDLGLTFAFLPHGPHTADQAELAKKLGHEVLLHFPMEPDNHRGDPGPGAAIIGMSRARLQELFAENLALVPQAVGVNNHMGSRFTRDSGAMRDFLALVRDNHLFFLDSLTTSSSVGYSLAQEMGVKAGRRQVFLDNVEDEAKITAQLRQLLAVAEQQGAAVGIGHPHPQTLAALRAVTPEILARTRMVAVSQLVK